MATADRFNPYVLRAVDKLAAERAGGGYDINSYFTRDLTYGPDCCVKANHPPLTMCVAGVCEIIIEALNLYRAETGDAKPFAELPLHSWTHGSLKDIRAHIFMYAGSLCRGTAHALARFGIGNETAFRDLEPGDFVNFNRTKTGHAAVFLGFINKDYAIEPDFSSRVAGFHYFSAQGKNSDDAGFGYRWAFFGDVCPAPVPGKRRDCGIRFSDDPAVLDAGHMLHPSAWKIEPAMHALSTMFRGEGEGGKNEGLAAELLPANLARFDGVTTD